MGKAKSKIEIRNKKASFEYEFLENYTAGIVLTGTEIKSIRAGKASLVDSWCYFAGGELYVNLFISETGYAKLDIALARGKKEYDKRESIKEKDLRRYSVSENPPHLRWVPSLFGSQSFRRYTYVRTAMSRRCLLASISFG